MKRSRQAWITSAVTLLVTVIAVLALIPRAGESADGADEDGLLLDIVPLIAVVGNLRRPPVPTLDPLPASTSATSLPISGVASPGLTVIIYLNGSIVQTVVAGSDGKFRALITLAPGANRVHAAARRDGLTGPASPAQTVILVDLNIPPLAHVVYGPPSGRGPLLVSFDGTGSVDEDGHIASWSWQFGDGGTSRDPAPAHQYTAVGSYTASLTVTDNGGRQSFVHVPVTVLPSTTAPMASLSYRLHDSIARAAPLGITFDGSGSRDSDGEIVRYEWNLGDGTAAPDQPIIEHTYRNPGDYRVSLTVYDDDGRASTSVTRVEALEPVAAILSASRLLGAAPLFIEFDASASQGEIAEYRWDFGDGTSRVLASHGINAARPSHLYRDSGSYTVTLTVRDVFGRESGQQLVIDIRPPDDSTNVDVDIRRVSATPPWQIEFTVADGDGLDWTLDLGDGNRVAADRVLHSYADSGTYPVSVTGRADGITTRQFNAQLFVGEELGVLDVGIDEHPTLVPAATAGGYRLTTGNLRIGTQGRLILAPGVSVAVASQGVHVEGDLIARGEPGRPIEFRSHNPDPAAGDWQGIRLLGGGHLDASHLIVRHATTGISGSHADRHTHIDNLVLDNNRIGWRTGTGPLTLQDSQVTRTTRSALVVRSGAFSIANSAIDGGDDCVQLAGSGTFENNRVSNCLQAGVRVEGDAILRANTITGIDHHRDITGPTGLQHLEAAIYRGPSAGIVLDAFDRDITLERNNLHDNHVGILFHTNTLLPYNLAVYDRHRYRPRMPEGKRRLTWNPRIRNGNIIRNNEYGVVLNYPQYRLKFAGIQGTSGLSYPALDIQPVINDNTLADNHRFNLLVTGKYGFPAATHDINLKGNWWGNTDLVDIYSGVAIEREGFYAFDEEVQVARQFDMAEYLDAAPPTGMPVYPGPYLRGPVTSESFSAGETYNVITPLEVPEGTVTVPAGVTLNLLGAQAVIEVEGELAAVGTSAQPVQFQSLRDSGKRGDWHGIVVQGGAFSATHTTIKNAVAAVAGHGDLLLENATLADNGIGLQWEEGSVSVSDSRFSGHESAIELTRTESGKIERSILTANNAGLRLAEMHHPFLVIDSEFSDHTDTAVALTGNVIDAVAFHSNRITRNTVGIGLDATRNDRLAPEFMNSNTITRNDTGIRLAFAPRAVAAPRFHGNSIYDNRVWNVELDRRETDQSHHWVDAQLNWWGSADPDVIGTGIYDALDHPLEATVRFNGLLESAPHPGSPIGRPPTASLSFSPATPRTLEAVTFDATLSHSEQGAITDYRWRLPAGIDRTGSIITHRFTEPGPQRVGLEVADTDGLVSRTWATVPVTDPPNSLFAVATARPGIVHARETLTFDATGSTASDAEIVSYHWDFDDGQGDIGPLATHQYAAPGDYLAVLTIEDDAGRIAHRGLPVRVLPPATDLQAHLVLDRHSGVAPLTVQFDATGTTGGSEPVTHVLDFGDGKSASSATGSHTYSRPGHFTITLKVTDSNGDTDYREERIVVTPPPLALQLDEPLPGSTTRTPYATVSGTVAGQDGVSVSIQDGFRVHYALVDTRYTPHRFHYNVPLAPGENHLEITAAAPGGDTARVTVSVKHDIPPTPLLDVAVEEPEVITGKPLKFILLDPGHLPISDESFYGFDIDGDDQPDTTFRFAEETLAHLADTGEAAVEFQLDTPGVYKLVVDLVEESGTAHSFVIPVKMTPTDEIDRQIQTSWSTLNRALLEGDHTGAMTSLGERAKDRYGDLFRALLAQFPSIISDYVRFQPALVTPGYAIYHLVRRIDGQELIFSVHFARDATGQWKLHSI